MDDKTLAHSYEGDATKFLQDVLNKEAAGTEKDKMVINETKCNVITFNYSDKILKRSPYLGILDRRLQVTWQTSFRPMRS